MNLRVLNSLVSFLIFCAIYLILYWITFLIFPSFGGFLKPAVLGGITVLISPRFKRYEVMGEKRYEFKWIFQQS
ncbi:hypothetical protein C7S20_10820 [Christiangramia fulva]|uniref:Uncharacterized protein n=1 Tax=Christiangramia fulva TaxID=2126553 RepID=A0A2R3Z617_9FLAO|nr:hypothetical protein [Christiangramia fulva]AVR45705.1 hypothetical protein C7S20_10820 [Christiangramia fulva]